MVYQPPTGARDLFPLDVAQKRWIEDRVQQVFHRWGYHRIITSTLERIDTLMAGGAVQRSTVISVQNRDEEELGLRPELTASIARAAATRLSEMTYPQRLYYNANVFRRSPRSGMGSQHEFYQAGVELLGAGGGSADAEVLLLMSDCVANLGLTNWHLILGEAGLTRSLLSSFPASVRESVRRAIAYLDRLQLESLPLSPELRERALLLLDLRGRPADVIQRVSVLDLDDQQRDTVNALKSLLELLHDSFSREHRSPPNLVLDLSLVQTFDYYTGIVFEVVSSSDSGQRVLGQGGRYDQLLSLYHPQQQTCPGIGFTFNIEDLHQVLLPTGQLPAQTPPSDWLVVPKTPEAIAAAFAYAQTIRDSAHLVRVEVDLMVRESQDATRRYAGDRRIGQIAWIAADGTPEIEPLSGRSP
ncbi:MAG: ATP phosphoribosyltransferase regulatory subunit [Elainellaceae cyanobacterium]